MASCPVLEQFPDHVVAEASITLIAKKGIGRLTDMTSDHTPPEPHARRLAAGSETQAGVGGRLQRTLRGNVLQLLQRSQRRFDEAILFLVAFDESNEFACVAQCLIERITQRLCLRQQVRIYLGVV